MSSKTIQNLGVSSSNLSTFAYTYDSNGEIVTWSKQWDAGSTLPSRFSYDAANQLLSAFVPSPLTQSTQAYFYGYDPAGNRTQEQIDSYIDTSTFDAANKYEAEAIGGSMAFAGSVSEPATVKVGGNTAAVDSFNDWLGTATVSSGTNLVPLSAMDSSGNSTSKTINVVVSGAPARTLTYDSNGNLTNNGTGQTYQWDAENRLVGIVQVSGTTGFVYDGAGHRVQETLNGTLIKQWVWCVSQPCEERDGSGNVTKRFYAQGEQIAGVPYYFTRDHLGSVREMTDGTGAIRARYDYDPYGRLTKISGDTSADFGFTGDYYHAASGLSLTMYRAYDPNLGRWLNRDPLGESGGSNLYGYARNNPISFVDPLGLSVSWAANADKQAVIATIGYLRQSPTFDAAWQQLIQSSTNYVIGSDIPPPGYPLGDFNNNAIVFDPVVGREFPDGIEYPAFTFAHEVKHAIDSDNGVLTTKNGCPSDDNAPPYYAPNQAEVDAQKFKVKVANELGAYANVQYDSTNWDQVYVPSPLPPQ